MHPDIISIGPFTIRSYGLMLATGFLTGILLAVRRARKAGENPEHIYNLAVWIVISSLFGARVYYIVTHYDEFRADRNLSALVRLFTELKNMFWPVGGDGQVGISGLILYGGLICATLATAIYLKKHNLNILKYMDIIGPSLGLGEFFTRLGCFLNGCCFGKPTESWCGVVFPESSAAGYYYPGLPLHPVQLYNALGGLAICFLLIFMERYKRFDGFTALLYFILYAIVRFTTDFFRHYETQMKLWGVSQNQVISMGVFCAAVSILVYLSRKTSQRKKISGENYAENTYKIS
jgi:phosphatidylglycerol:prolipoprotein diacylglycerol transferase